MIQCLRGLDHVGQDEQGCHKINRDHRTEHEQNGALLHGGEITPPVSWHVNTFFRELFDAVVIDPIHLAPNERPVPPNEHAPSSYESDTPALDHHPENKKTPTQYGRRPPEQTLKVNNDTLIAHEQHLEDASQCCSLKGPVKIRTATRLESGLIRDWTDQGLD